MAQPVLVIEDDSKISRIVKVYLEGSGYSVITAGKGREGIQFALKEPPLIVILDLMLPDISGEQVCQELKDIGDFPVIMLTAKSSEEERVAGFGLGADDYVVKPFSPKELVARVKAVLKRYRRRGISGQETMSFNNNLLTIDQNSYEVKKNGNTISLTPTELKILAVLAGSPGRVFTRGELVDHALGYQFEGYERSIDAHIKNIRQKIEDDPKNPFFIHTIYGVGYKFTGSKDA